MCGSAAGGNRGPARARNEGIGRAQGAFIAILDADDIACVDRIERQLFFIRKSKADVVGSCYRLVNAEGVVVGTKSLPLSEEAIHDALCMLNPIANSTVLARAEVLKEFQYGAGKGGTTHERYGEDYALWVRLARRGYRLCNQRAYLVDFRLDKGFLRKRRGFEPFYTDLRTKLRTLPLYPLHRKPVAALAAISSSSLRLLPAPLLGIVYRIRNRLFSARHSSG